MRAARLLKTAILRSRSIIESGKMILPIVTIAPPMSVLPTAMLNFTNGLNPRLESMVTTHPHRRLVTAISTGLRPRLLQKSEPSQRNGKCARNDRGDGPVESETPLSRNCRPIGGGLPCTQLPNLDGAFPQARAIRIASQPKT